MSTASPLDDDELRAFHLRLMQSLQGARPDRPAEPPADLPTVQRRNEEPGAAAWLQDPPPLSTSNGVTARLAMAMAKPDGRFKLPGATQLLGMALGVALVVASVVVLMAWHSAGQKKPTRTTLSPEATANSPMDWRPSDAPAAAAATAAVPGAPSAGAPALKFSVDGVKASPR